jgi:hypothetical protein
MAWASHVQPTVASSTTGAECMAGRAATRERLWLRTLLSELEMGVGQIVLMCDNQSALN